MSCHKIRSLIQRARSQQGWALLSLFAIIALGYATELHAANPPVCYISLNIPSFLDEGELKDGEVTRDPVDGQPLVVTLTSSDTGEAIVPSSVTIPANMANAIFPITGQPDSLVDGNIDVTISGDGGNYGTDSKVTTVNNIDVAALTLTPSSQNMFEGSTGASLTVTRNTDTANSLVVAVSSSLPNELGGPPYTVTIPALASSQPFTIASIQDDLDESDETATVTVSASGFASDQATVLIQDDDATPIFSPSLPSAPGINENNGYSVNFDVTDADDANPTVSKSGPDAGLFILTQNANDWTLSLNIVPDYEGPLDLGANNTYEVTIDATDGTNPAPSQTLILTINDVNEAPGTISHDASTLEVDENASAGTPIASFSVTDPDNLGNPGNQSHSFTVVGAHSNLFEFAGSTLQTKIPVPGPTPSSYSINVQATDDGSPAISSSLQSFTVDINQVDSPPTWLQTSYSFPEHGTGTIQLMATDPDNDPITFTEVGGADGGQLNVTSTGGLSFANAPDYENPTDALPFNSYEILVALTAGPVTTSAVTITVNVTPVNEAPNPPTLSPGSVDENAANTSVGLLSVIDPDNQGINPSSPAQTYSYEFVGSSNPVDNGFFTISGSQIFTKTGFDYENVPAGSNAFSIKATQVGEASKFSSDSFTIQINPIDELPSIGYSGAFSTSEDQSFSAVNSVTVSDPETPTANLTVTASSSNQSIIQDAGVSVVGTGSSRTLQVNPVSHASGTVTLFLNVSDLVNPVVTLPLVFTVDELNDPPSFTQEIADLTITEDQTGGTGQLSFTLDDVDNTAAEVTVTPTSSNPTIVPNNNITIDGTGWTRTVTVVPGPNQNGTVDITLSADDGAGGTVDSDFQLTITHVNDSPTMTQIAAQTVIEDQAGGTGALAFSVNDIDNTFAELSVLPTASSNPSLVPLGNVLVSGTGQNRTVTVTPVSDGFGSSTITLTVDDGLGGQTQMSFGVNVSGVNDKPEIGAISGASVVAGQTTAPIALPMSDDETPVPSLLVSAISLSPTLVGNGLITITESGGLWSMTVGTFSGGSGTATIALSVEDGGGLIETRNVSILVNAPGNSPPSIGSISGGQVEVGEVSSPIALPLSDDNTLVENLQVSASSLDPNTLSNSSISVSQSGGAWSLVVAPLLGSGGSVPIELTVVDESLAASVDTFTMQVNARVPDPPTIEAITDQAYHANETFLYPGLVKIDDPDTSASFLSVWGSSSNQNVVADANIRVTGLGKERDLQITPATNQSGTITITLFVSDASTSVATAFEYTVLPSGIPPADTDGDGICDIEEDPNGDGLPDLPDPSHWNDSDSDMDGLPDGAERIAGFDPRSADSDSDGVQDDREAGNSDPIAGDDSVTLEEGSGEMWLNVLANDLIAPDTGEVLEIQSAIAVGTPVGTVAVASDGRNLIYTMPGEGATGAAMYDYTISDGFGGFDTARLTVTVVESNLDPTLSAINDIEMPVNVTWSPFQFTVTDPDGSDSAITVTAHADNLDLFPEGSIVFSGNGADRSFSLSPTLNQFGQALITLVASDGNESVSEQFVVRVGPHGFLPADSDLDLVPDYLEDVDGNGIPDVGSGETTWARSDTDGDLISDALELILGSDPNVADSPMTNQAGLILFNEFK